MDRAANSVLYGTTSIGGMNCYGTIFSLVIPPMLSIQQSGTNVIVTWPSTNTGFLTLQSATKPGPADHLDSRH